MTKYGEDIAVLKSEMQDVKANIKSMKDAQDAGFKALADKIDNLDNRYPTRREFAAANWVVGVVFTVLAIYLAIRS